MDSDMWLVEAMDTGPKSLCSPGGNSSGYCSSEDNILLVPASKKSTVELLSNISEQTVIDPPPFSSQVDHPMISQDNAFNVAKTNTTFDGFADSLWEPFASTEADYSEHNSVLLPHRPVYHGLIAKQLAPSRKPVHPGNSCDPEFSQAMSVWGRHVASELGNPFAPMVDDCRSMYNGGRVHSGDMAVDVITKCSSSNTPNVVIRALPRTRGSTSLTSCGTILRHSKTVPNKLQAVAGQVVVPQCSPSRSDHLYSHPGQVLKTSESSPSIHDALRDHMYALKVPPPVPVHRTSVDWLPASQSKQGHCQSVTTANLGRMSILEAFLRSTTQCFDANRGSNALAAEELKKLHVSNSQCKSLTKVNKEEECSMGLTRTKSASLLKQLLTSDVSDVDLELSQCSDTEDESPGMAIDSVLTDGFGLDANLQLDDPLSNGIGLLEDDDNMAARKLVTDASPMMSSLDLNDDSVSEEIRQENLWLQHYITELL